MHEVQETTRVHGDPRILISLCLRPFKEYISQNSLFLSKLIEGGIGVAVTSHHGTAREKSVSSCQPSQE